ncbi:MAG: 4-hydroxythreonine-4-phosphate dehydrogenase PdxA [Prevotella sp.]|nr:4-hydroxythreonine-4-phosphate dehydrogenase PdxA [Prevotella sp.]
MENRKIRVAITHGDTNGVGYEVIFKAFEDPAMLELCTPIIYGSPKAAAYHGKAVGIDPQFTIIHQASEAKEGRLNLLTTFDDEVKIDLGMPTPEAGEAAMTALNRAISDYKEDGFDVLVTAPVAKNSVKDFDGHTAYLSNMVGEGRRGLTILVSDSLRVALVTNNVSLKDVPEALSRQKIVEKATIFHETLRRDMRISSPRIAVLALNPRGGEDGILGDEEQEMIKPAIEQLVEQGIQAFGPYPADDFFGNGYYASFDGVLAMYHDQGQTPFKAITSISDDRGVRVTAGLPIVRTAPAYGALFELAGKGQMEAETMRHAIYMAIDMWRNRQDYDEPLANPLPKLYHERREDGDRPRFNMPREKRELRNDRNADNQQFTDNNEAAE